MVRACASPLELTTLSVCLAFPECVSDTSGSPAARPFPGDSGSGTGALAHLGLSGASDYSALAFSHSQSISIRSPSFTPSLRSVPAFTSTAYRTGTPLE